jgi:hypothetical protein
MQPTESVGSADSFFRAWSMASQATMSAGKLSTPQDGTIYFISWNTCEEEKKKNSQLPHSFWRSRDIWGQSV